MVSAYQRSGFEYQHFIFSVASARVAAGPMPPLLLNGEAADGDLIKDFHATDFKHFQLHSTIVQAAGYRRTTSAGGPL